MTRETREEIRTLLKLSHRYHNIAWDKDPEFPYEEFKQLRNKFELLDYATQLLDELDEKDREIEELMKEARHILRNYEKCSQYPENISLHERDVRGLRNVVLEIEALQARGSK